MSDFVIFPAFEWFRISPGHPIPSFVPSYLSATPTYFRQTKIRSFYRRKLSLHVAQSAGRRNCLSFAFVLRLFEPFFSIELHLWGFKKIFTGIDTGAWFHESFLRGRPRLISGIVRLKIKGSASLVGVQREAPPQFEKMERLPDVSLRELAPVPPSYVKAFNNKSRQPKQRPQISELTCVFLPENGQEHVPSYMAQHSMGMHQLSTHTQGIMPPALVSSASQGTSQVASFMTGDNNMSATSSHGSQRRRAYDGQDESDWTASALAALAGVQDPPPAFSRSFEPRMLSTKRPAPVPSAVTSSTTESERSRRESEMDPLPFDSESEGCSSEDEQYEPDEFARCIENCIHILE